MKSPFKPKGMPSLVPYIYVRDGDESFAFYQKVFQFEVIGEPHKENNKIIHAEFRLGEAVVMMAPEGAWGSNKKAPMTTGVAPNICLYIYVEDVDAFFKHASLHGAQVISEPENMFWGDRCCMLRDIDGYEWSFGTHVGEHGQPPKA